MEWVCKYCNCSLDSRRKLYKHYKECTEKLKLPHDSMGRVVINGSEKSKRGANTFKEKVKLGLASYKGHKHTEEAKKKISEGRLKALREGRGNHWICPHIKQSYAEKYFTDVFNNANLKFETNVWLCKRYCVDFLFGNYYFEVDGEQHFTDEAIKHDDERERFLFEHGYKCIGRCRWKDYNKLSFEEKENYINGLVTQLAEVNGSNPF